MQEDDENDRKKKRDPRVVNAAIEGFLGYYVDPDHPLDYAVLVSGPWGSGKTHLVKKFLASTSAKPLYVSLYGMTSTAQIEEEFYRQLHPLLSHKGMRIAGSVAKAVLKGTLKIDLNGDHKDDGTLNVGIPDIDLKSDLSDPRDRLLVFDDLERCKMPIGEVLGFINAFVEHDGVKAIIIANETKVIKADAGYKEIKEKLIGQTLEVEAAADDAFDAFLDIVSDQRSRDFLAAHRDVVLGIHAEGGRGNLRTLKHAMWDFEKIARHLEQRHWDNEEAITKVLKGVLAVSMEHRAGKLDERILTSLIGNKIGRLLRTQNGTPKGKVEKIEGRYPQVDFDDIVLNADVLAAVLLRGEADAKAIVAAADASRDFAPVGSQPLWLRAMSSFQDDEDDAAAIAAEVEKAFADMAVHERGELMQMFGVRLWLAEVGMIGRTRAEVLADGLEYLKSLEEKGLIADRLGEPRMFDRDNSFGGYRVLEAETAEYRKLAESYAETVKRIEEAKYPAIAEDLLKRLPTEPDDVLLDMVVNNVRQAPYYNRPVLATIAPADFVARLIAWDARTQTHALELLKGRHELRHGVELDTERTWLAEVERLLVAALDGLPPMTRFRLRAGVDRNLVPLGLQPPTAKPEDEVAPKKRGHATRAKRQQERD